MAREDGVAAAGASVEAGTGWRLGGPAQPPPADAAISCPNSLPGSASASLLKHKNRNINQ